MFRLCDVRKTTRVGIKGELVLVAGIGDRLGTLHDVQAEVERIAPEDVAPVVAGDDDHLEAGLFEERRLLRARFLHVRAQRDEPTRADIILCTDVLEKEAAEQKKSVEEHTAHLIVHGVLHAQGYDHMDDEEAAEMEGLETEILAKLGISDPYADLK